MFPSNVSKLTFTKLKLSKVQDHIRDTNEKIENLTLEFEAINEYLGDLGSLGLDHCHGKLLVVREKIQIVNELKLTVNDLQRDHKLGCPRGSFLAIRSGKLREVVYGVYSITGCSLL